MKSYLMHHGILGQKWGKRNGPPYPLKPSDHSAAEKKKQKSEGSNKKKDPNHKMGTYEEEAKIAEKVGKSSLEKFEKLYKQYANDQITDEQYYDQLEKQVYQPIIKAGFEWVSRGGGSDGYLHLQFGRDLSDLEVEERNGEEWVQEWLVENNWPGITDMNKEW